MPSLPDLDEPLRGELVELRFEAERDIPEILIAHQEDPELVLRLGIERPPSGAELGRRIDRAAEDRATGAGVRFTIVRAGADHCCGQLDVHQVDWDHLRAEVGVWIALRARGQGLAAEALRLAARWLFTRCGLARVEALTEVENFAMIAAGRKAGMLEEGVLRAYVRERGKRVDVKMLSLLPTDLEPS
jgi:RimJ/RimL family protein N-acetyltransferase